MSWQYRLNHFLLLINMTVKYSPNGDGNFIININDLPHVILKRSEFLGTRAYAEPPVEPLIPKQYCIEFVMKGNSFTCKYADRQLWVEVLEIINKFI